MQPRNVNSLNEAELSEHLKRLTSDWGKIAGEEIRVERIGGTYYAFGSELACFRLWAKFRNAKGTRVEFSKNLESWFFAL